MSSSAPPPAFALRFAVAALAATSACADSVAGDGSPVAHVSFQAEYPSVVAPGVFDLDIDRVRIRITRPPAEAVIDTVVLFPPDDNQLSIRLKIPLIARREQLGAALEMSAGTRLLFAGTRTIEVTEESSVAPPIPLQFVGPGTEMTSLRIEPRDSALAPGTEFTFGVHALTGQAVLEDFYVGWSTSDPDNVPVNARGTLRAPGARGSVLLRVVSPTGIKDSTRVWFSPPAVSMDLESGSGQVAQVGTQLATLLAVKVLAADGLGVPGVRVRFQPLAGGAAVRDTTTITDGNGVARTAAILGRIAGIQAFEASAPQLPPVVFITTGVPGPPSRIISQSGGGQTGTVGALLPSPFVARVTDANGNSIPDVPLTWSVPTGNGTLEEVDTRTGLGGTAFATYRLGTSPGTNVVRASIQALAVFTEFTATASPGSPAALEGLTGDGQTDSVRATLAPFTVIVRDEFGNALSGVQVQWSEVDGGGVLDQVTTTTDATGRARVTYRLPETVGIARVEARVQGVPAPVTFTATAVPASASGILIFAGDAQTGLTGTELEPFVVRITDQFGNAVSGVAVTWTVEAGEGQLASDTTLTDASGSASVLYTLGAAAGDNKVRARLSPTASVVFTATATTLP